MNRLVFTEAAEFDLEAIGDHIARENPARALSFVLELKASSGSIVDMPERHPLLHRHRDSGIRRRVHGNYLIFYRVTGASVEILHILHGAMDHEAILFPDA